MIERLYQNLWNVNTVIIIRNENCFGLTRIHLQLL